METILGSFQLIYKFIKWAEGRQVELLICSENS